MKETTKKIMEETAERHSALLGVMSEVEKAFETLKSCFEQGNRWC